MAKRATARQEPRALETSVSDLGQRIRAARQERGLSLAQVGGQDLSRSFLSAVEHGRTRISLRALSIVAERLGRPMSYFLDTPTSQSEALPELVLDESESGLRQQKPAEALRLLDEVEVPGALRARALWLRGWALIDLGRPREAIPVLQEARSVADQSGDARLSLLIQYKLGTALFCADDYDEALIYFRRALQLAAEQPDDRVLIGKITVCIGHIQYVQGQYDAALGQYARARQLFGAVDDLDNLASVYTGLSRVYEHMGDLDNAVRYSRMSVGIYELKHNKRLAAHEMNNMAARCRELGSFDQALEYARQAIAWAQESKAHDVEGLAHATLAAIHYDLDDLDAAETEAEVAQSVGCDGADLASIDAWIVQAKVAERRADHARTDQLYGRALDMLERMGHRTLYADTALAYSRALQTRGDINQALNFALKSAEMKATRPA